MIKERIKVELKRNICLNHMKISVKILFYFYIFYCFILTYLKMFKILHSYFNLEDILPFE